MIKGARSISRPVRPVLGGGRKENIGNNAEAQSFKESRSKRWSEKEKDIEARIL